MTLTEIQSKKAAARAKMEDLIQRTASRELSTEEKQIMADLQAEGVSLNGLIARYEALASFDGPTDNKQQVIVPQAGDKAAREAKAFDAFMRRGVQATDVPLQIVDSPVHGAASLVPKTILAGQENFPDNDSATALGANIIPVDNFRDVVWPFDIDTADAVSGGETTRTSESVVYTSNHATLSPVELVALSKQSQRSISDPAIDITGKVLRSLTRRILRTASKNFASALETALHANTHCHVLAGADEYDSVTKLSLSLSQSYASDSNVFAANKNTLQLIANARASGTGAPLFDFSTKQLLGHRAVLVDSLTDGYLYYGSWRDAAIQVRTPLAVQRLVELYAEHGLIGYLGVAGFDQAFYSELTSVTDQPVKYCLVSADAGS